MIKAGVDVLKQVKGKGRNKRNNILNILNNIELSLFEVLYYHYKDLSKKTRQSKIAEGAKLRRQWLDEVKKREKKHK